MVFLTNWRNETPTSSCYTLLKPFLYYNCSVGILKTANHTQYEEADFHLYPSLFLDRAFQRQSSQSQFVRGTHLSSDRPFLKHDRLLPLYRFRQPCWGKVKQLFLGLRFPVAHDDSPLGDGVSQCHFRLSRRAAGVLVSLPACAQGTMALGWKKRQLMALGWLLFSGRCYTELLVRSLFLCIQGKRAKK